MIGLIATWKKAIAELERERDVLRVKAHFGKAEARDLLVAAKAKLHQLRLQLASITNHAKESVKHGEEKMRVLADELRALLARIQDIV